MRNQLQMLSFLNNNIPSHVFKSGGNKIHGEKSIGSRSFKNFTITFIKSAESQVSLSMQGVTKRYDCEDGLLRVLGSVAIIESDAYENARYNLNKAEVENK